MVFHISSIVGFRRDDQKLARGRCRSLLIALALCFVVAPDVILGQPSTEDPPPAAEGAAPPMEGAQPAPPAANGEGMITLDFPEDVEVKVLVDYVGRRLGLNILYDNMLAEQRVTIRAGTAVSKDDLLSLLQSVLQMKQFALVDTDNPAIKKIIPAGNMPSNAAPVLERGDKAIAVTQIFQLKNFDASRADQIIKPFLSQPGGNSVGISERRMLIVTDFAANMQRLEDLVKMMDQAGENTLVEVIPLAFGDAAALAPQITAALLAQNNQSGSPAVGGMIEVLGDARSNSLIVIGTAPRIADAKALVKELDKPSPLETRTYTFRVASPERIDKLIRGLIDPAAINRVFQSSVDKEARLLVVSAGPELHARIESLRKELDVAAEHVASPVRFYKLANTKAKDVLETIQGITGDSEDSGGGGWESDPGYGSSSSRGRANPLRSERRSNSSSRASRATTRPTMGRESGLDSQDSSAASSGGGSASLYTDDATVTADENTNTIIVVAEPATQKIYEDLIRELDKRRPQVMLECIIVTLDTSNNFTLGVDIGIAGSNGESDIITFSNFGIGRPRTQNGFATGRLGVRPGLAGFNGALISSDIADVVINALATNTRARVMSAPRLLVNDNATGVLESIAEQPYREILSLSTDVASTGFAGYAEAGTTIELTPTISEADYLQLEYSVSMNSFTGEGTNDSPPPRQTDALESTVTIPDGSTIVVGGLNRKGYRSTENEVPILGNIPILEYLFGTRSITNQETTLFVFIRPVILRDDRFEDLKYFSHRDRKAAGVPDDEPVSVPLTVY